MTAVTAEVTAHRVERTGAGRRRPAREDRERARRAAEEAGPQGRPENAILGPETCCLRGQNKRENGWGRGVAASVLATGLKNRS